MDASFVTSRTHPAEFHGCRDLAGIDLAAAAPVSWTSENDRAAQRAALDAELFFMDRPAAPDATFPEWFQHDSDSLTKVRRDPRQER